MMMITTIILITLTLCLSSLLLLLILLLFMLLWLLLVRLRLGLRLFVRLEQVGNASETQCGGDNKWDERQDLGGGVVVAANTQMWLWWQ